MNLRTIQVAGSLATIALAVSITAAQHSHRPATADEIANSISRKVQQAVAAGNAPAGYRLVDGDMLLPDTFNPDLDGFFQANLWTNGVIPYEFNFTYPLPNRPAVIAAMQSWQAVAGVSFVARSNQSDYVLITLSSGNSSPVGRQGGQQALNLSLGAGQQVIIHELGHCLGFLHEHQRPDRRVTVQPCNVQGVTCVNGIPLQYGTTYDVNFPIITTNSSAWAPYDFESIMHYSRCAFSTGCPAGTACNCASNQETMTVMQPDTATWNTVIGNATTISAFDALTMRGLYPFNGDRWASNVSGGIPAGTFLNPWTLNVSILANNAPSNGTVYFKAAGNYAGVGTYNQAVTLIAPVGAVTLGN